MAEWTPPAEAKIVEAPAWTPPAEAKIVGAASKESEPSTTAPGLAASAARGLAPYAAGAAIGAAAGAPFAGVGAVPGAIAGMGATAATELGGTLYNMIAPHVSRLPQIMTPQGATDRLLDAFGIKRPASSIERGVEMAAPMTLAGVGGAKTAAESAAADISAIVSENRAGAAERYIDRLYSRAIKPSTVGRDTAPQRRSAISDIVEQKSSLRYTDAEGKTVSEGHLPKTPAQFGEAIDQSKDSLFKQWDALDRAAEGAGARVDTAPIVSKLLEKAADPVLLRDDPNAAKYAAELAQRYASAGPLLPSEVQRSIAGWNQKLKAYYRNPAAEGAGHNGINETLASELRSSLDRTVTESVAPGYQALKNRYGALRAIEDDVDRATRRISNREPGGGLMGRAVNLVAGEEGIRGLLTGNWKSVATGAGVKGFGELVKYLHSPNRAITKMFEKAEKYHKAPMDVGGVQPGEATPQTSGMQPPRPTGPAQDFTGTQGGGVLQGGGAAAPAAPMPTYPRQPTPIDPFLTPPGGGRVSRLIDPDEGLARALGYLA